MKVQNALKLVLPVEAAISNRGEISLPTAKMAMKRPKKVAKIWWKCVLNECIANLEDTKPGFI